MAYNKIEANGETLIDLTSDTVTADTLLSGRTAHLASGEKATGTFIPVTGVKGNAESTYRKGDVNLTPANLGLGNVNNTSDLDKPISTATQAALDSQQWQIDYNTNSGVKNLFKITKASATINGVTFTVDNVAGTITANGTATALIIFFLEERSKYLMPGNYRISSGNNSNNYWFGVYLDSTAGQWFAKAENEEFTIPEQYTFTQCALRIASGQTMNNVVFKPMIRDASIEDDTFQPYAKSNVELTQDLDDISEEFDCLVINAALVNNEVIIQNTSDFTSELYSKYFSYTKPKFAILKLQITSNTYYYKALLNSSSVSQATVMEASFITVNGTYMSIYKFNWSLSGTVGTPTVSHTSLNLGS